MKYRISIDRAASSWAVFDEDFTLKRPFEKFTDEATALEEATAWVKERSEVDPDVVYPCITSIRTSYRRKASPAKRRTSH
jgi:hypothetical protein